MKKALAFISVVAMMVAAASAAYAGLFSSVMTADWPTVATKKYKLTMYGFDARAYEFSTDNGMNCVVVFSGGDTNAMGMQCVKK